MRDFGLTAAGAAHSGSPAAGAPRGRHLQRRERDSLAGTASIETLIGWIWDRRSA